MSLINDALKRATKSHTAPPNPGHSGTSAPMKPADGHPPGGLPRYFFPILLCVFCGAFWFIVRGWESRRQAGIYPEPITVHAREGVPDPEKAALAPSADTTLPIPENRSFDVEGGPSSGPSASAASAGAGIAGGPSSPATQAFRLQGIFYRQSNPSAMVNTTTVFVGDFVSGARVKAIDRLGVTLEHADGRTEVLTLQ